MDEGAKVIESITVSCPLEAFFEFVTNFENDKKWWNGVIDARQVSETRDAPGTRYLQVVRLFGQTFEVEVEVVEYARPHHLMIRNERGLTPFVATYTFETIPDGTRFTMDSQVQARGVFRLLQPLFVPLLRAQTKQNFQNLKRVVEATVCP